VSSGDLRDLHSFPTRRSSDLNAVMIQLPWTVPQQPFDQTASVVENPNRKMELDLNHSTDTTAISPFTLSVIIALILGSFATWLRSEEHTSELQSRENLVCRLL